MAAWASIVCACLLAGGTPATAWASSPEELQQRADSQVATYRQQVRKTGDKAVHANSLRQALQAYRVAGRAWDADGDDLRAATCRVGAAHTLRHLDRFQEALDVYAEAETLARRADAQAVLADALVGQIHVRLYGTKQYEQAEAAASEALRVTAPLADQTRMFEALLLRSEVAQAQADWPAALEWINRAFGLPGPISDQALWFYAYTDRHAVHFQLARACETQAVYEFCRQQADLAVDNAEQAVRIAQQQGWDFLANQADRLRRSATLRRDQIQQQADFAKIDFDVFHPLQPADVLVNQQFIAPEPAKLPAELIEAVRSWHNTLPDDPVAVYIRAHIDQLSGQDDRALAGYLQAIQLLEQDYRALSDLEARGALVGHKIDFYYMPMLHQLQRGQLDEAFGLMEVWRSRILMDLLMTQQEIELAQPQERELYRRLRQLRAQIAGHRSGYELEQRIGGVDVQAGRWANEFASLQQRHKRLLEEIQSQAPQLLSLTTATPAPLAKLQQAAAEGGYDLLEYLVLDSQLIVWHIGKSGVHVRSVFLPHAELARKVQSLRNTVVDPRVAFDESVSRELFLFLIQPLLSELTSDHLVVIPHRELFYLPFQTLQDPADGRFVGEQFRVTYSPSATVWLGLRPVASLAGNSILAVAAPGLPEAQSEAESLVELNPQQSQLIAAPQATEAYVSRQVGAYDVLHIAAHGYFNAAEPMLSYVQLTPRDPDDGKLTAAEMFALPLEKTQLVTLSACETARVAGTYASEIIGMPQALLSAGAQAVLLSNWKVDSQATLLWMQHFYREAARCPLGEAAQRASGALKAQRGYEHPYYWAGFSLIGK